jgi:hypothetical protein
MYLRQAHFWRLLAGRWDPEAWPAPLDPREEMRLLALTIADPPDRGFLVEQGPARDDRFDWPHLVRLALFWYALADHAAGYPYVASLDELRRRHAMELRHPVHRPLAYRQYGHAVRPSRRRSFHCTLRQALEAWRG